MKRLPTYFLFFITLLFIGQAVQASQKLVLGVYQYQSQESVQNQYQEFANYLSNSLPNNDVELKVYNPDRLLTALQNNQVHLLLVNPNLYEILRTKVSLNGITATQQLIHEGHALDQLGGVIFTKQTNKQIHQLSDLKNQSIAIPSKSNTGAYRVPLYEMYKAGIDYKKLTFKQVGDNDSVVEAVLSGEADVGFVRTGILEKWHNTNRLKLDQIRIINPQKHPRFPHLVSTELYPEWPFIILPGLDENLNRDIAVAIFALRAEHPAAQQAGIEGFVAPRDYQKFESLLRTLKFYPYDTQPDITLLELWQQYKTEILIFLVLFILILALLVITARRKEVITRQEQRLKKQNHIDQVLLELPKYAETHSENELLQYALDKIEKILISPISFIHSVSHDQEAIQLLAWSNNTLKTYCHIDSYEDHYPISKAGVWAEAARKKHAIVINDYTNYKDKKGMPEGHAILNRMISLPIVEHDKVVMIAGVGNKDREYTREYVNNFHLIMNEVWRTIKLNRTNQKIIKQKNEFERLLNDLGDDYMVFSYSGEEGILSYVSAGFTTLFEQPVESILNRSWLLDIDWLPDSIDIANKSIQSLLSGEQTTDAFKLQFYTPNYQKLKTILVQQQAVYEDDKLVSIDGLITDITDKNESEQRLKQAATVFESANEGILICDKNNTIVRANQRVEEITGYSEMELLGKNPKIFSSGDQNNKFYKDMWNQLFLDGTWEGELWNRRQNGEVYPQRLKISTVFDDNKEPAYFIGLLSDITFEKEHQNAIEKMAHFDALTNLPNRFLLSDRISQAIHSIQRTDDMIAIMFVDLDGFKLVNDTYGHQAGDKVLKVITDLMSERIRSVDFIARYGGEEFLMILQGASSKDAAEVSERIRYQIEDTIFNHGEQQIGMTVSIGVCGFPETQVTNEVLLIDKADQALYHAKQTGRNRVVQFGALSD